MNDDLTPIDYAYLILLKAEGGEISNNEMDKRYGVRLVSPDHARLNGAGYVITTKKGSTYSHHLSDKGEKALREPMDIAEAKEKTRAVKEKLFWAALSALYADRLPAGTGRPAPTKDGRGLDTRIRAAYDELKTGHGAWVSLTRLRPLLRDVRREDLDKALVRLLDAPDVNLEPEPNQKTLTVADRKAAVRIGGEDRHLLAIGMP
jgi:hypothetical protein